MIKIDGSRGEGGGQILRTALALSCLFGEAIEIANIRVGRSEPGLKHQHLAAIKAIGRISDGKSDGARLGSTIVAFQPGKIDPGTYHFDVGTAGSTMLVLQTVYLPLALAGDSSRLKIEGGTHVPWSPAFEHTDRVWCSALRQAGIDLKLSLLAAGFYPRGGGRIDVKIQNCEKIAPLHILERGPLKSLSVTGAVANLDDRIAERMTRMLNHRAKEIGIAGKMFKSEIFRAPCHTQGAYVFVQADFEHARAGFVGLGEPGKRAEIVAGDVWEETLVYLKATAPVESHLADQLLLPLSIADGPSEFRTTKVTSHLLTNAKIIEMFGAAKMEIEGMEGSEGRVSITPSGKFSLHTYSRINEQTPTL